jgi:UDP-glucose 4-epimerase
MAKRNILVTGVANEWGARVVSQLLAGAGGDGEEDYHVIGLDTDPPAKEIKDLDFIQADIRNPLLVELLRAEDIHTVCHLVFFESEKPNEASFDLNVMGTMKVLGACAEAGVSKVVLKSSMMVYGADPNNPSFITEEAPLQVNHTSGSTRHLVEIEAFCNGFRRQTPEMILTVLRFASIIGPQVESPLTRFLTQPLAPKLLGFDPLMQVIHERDVVGALVHAINNDIPGVFNVAAEGILPLSRLMALAAKSPLPVVHLFGYWSRNLMNTLGLPAEKYWPIEPDYLRYPWVGDLAKMREELGYVPQYTAEEALREFAGEQRLRRYLPESVAMAYDEERLRDTIERRRRARDLQASAPRVQED